VNVPFVMKPDGTGLTRQKVFIGGHPEWESGHRMIGLAGGRQVLYDTDSQQVVGTNVAEYASRRLAHRRARRRDDVCILYLLRHLNLLAAEPPRRQERQDEPKKLWTEKRRELPKKSRGWLSFQR